MAVGRSARIVVDLDPELKQRLHARLRNEGRDFKGWLLERVRDYLEPSRGDERTMPELSEIEKRVLEAVSSDAREQHHVDALVDATGLRFGEVQEALLRLELRGCVTQHVGFYRGNQAGLLSRRDDIV